MEKLKIFYLKYKHAVPLIIYAIIYMTWFAWLEKNITGHYRRLLRLEVKLHSFL